MTGGWSCECTFSLLVDFLLLIYEWKCGQDGYVAPQELDPLAVATSLDASELHGQNCESRIVC